MDWADWLLAGLFSAVIVVISAGIVWRYLLNKPLVWTVELSRILFVWLTFIGAAVAVRDGVHVRVTLLVDLLPPAARRLLAHVNVILSLGFLALMMGLGNYWVYLSTGSKTPALNLPENWAVYGALPAGFALASYYALRRLISGPTGKQNKNTPVDGEKVQL